MILSIHVQWTIVAALTMKMRSFFFLSAIFLGAELFATKPPVVDPVETQSLAEQVKRLVTAMDLLGKQLNAKTKNAILKCKHH